MSADMAVQEWLSLLMSGDVRGIEYGASDHDTGNERCLMAVRDESQGWQRPGNDQVSPFPDGNRACQGACPHCVCRIYGAGIGVLTVLIRQFGAYPEGTSFAILIMNAFTPLINRYCKPARFA